jgi:hypothetical protein
MQPQRPQICYRAFLHGSLATESLYIEAGALAYYLNDFSRQPLGSREVFGGGGGGQVTF